MELATLDLCGIGSGGLTMHVNKVGHVKTIDRVAADIGESVDRLYDIAMGKFIRLSSLRSALAA